jgi:hypothetical protein
MGAAAAPGRCQPRAGVGRPPPPAQACTLSCARGARPPGCGQGGGGGRRGRGAPCGRRPPHGRARLAAGAWCGARRGGWPGGWARARTGGAPKPPAPARRGKAAPPRKQHRLAPHPPPVCRRRRPRPRPRTPDTPARAPLASRCARAPWPPPPPRPSLSQTRRAVPVASPRHASPLPARRSSEKCRALFAAAAPACGRRPGRPMPGEAA